MTDHHLQADEKTGRNGRIIGVIILVVVVMFGFGFAIVPLYNVFCEVTGLSGKVRTEAVTEKNLAVDETREITMEFVTALNKDTPMKFRAETPKLKIHPGQYYTVKFHAENLTDHAITARAIPSVAPGEATKYLEKVECFCFTEQTFEPHQHKVLPVRFVIETGLPQEMKDVTLSYTFFDISNKQQNINTR